MAREYPPIAKITRPLFTGVLLRKRLFRHLDSSRDRPIIWVSGPPGCGKTTLIASYLDSSKIPCLWYQVDEGDVDISTFYYYTGLAAKKAAPQKRKPLPLLTPEYLGGVSTFTLRYFENLFSRLKTPFAIVFDGYQRVPAESKFHEVISEGLNVIPEKMNAIVVSRGDPPPQFVQLHANNKISFLGWHEIRFTLNESREIIRMKGQSELTDKILPHLYEKTEGWAAGLILMMEMAKIKDIDYQMLDRLTPKEIFDYFKSEIFEKTDRETQDFLLKTAFLPRMTSQMAEKLTGIRKSEQILSDLNQRHYFTERRSLVQPVYRYHSLFREFLLSRAKDSFDHDKISLIQQTAAAILEESDQIEDAADLLLNAGEWKGITRLILSHARSLVAQGRNKTLEGWLKKIPEEVLDKIPWLLYWLGVSQMPLNPAECCRHFEKAFELFNIQQDAVGILLSWAAYVDTIIYEMNDFTPLDRWIKWLDNRMVNNPSFPSPEIEAYVACSMAGALVWRRPEHPQIKRWIERALLLSEKIEDINLCLRIFTNVSFYCRWMGDFANCSILVEEMKKRFQSSITSPLTLLTLKQTEAAIYSLSALTHGDSLQAVSEGQEIIRKSGVHICDQEIFAFGAYSSLNIGDTTMAGKFLQKMEATLENSRRSLVSHYCFIAAWYNLLLGNISNAFVHAERALKLVVETGIPFPEIACRLVMAQVLHEKGEYKQALTQISLTRKLINKIGCLYSEYIFLLTEAQFALDKGEETACLESLRKAIALGKKQGYLTMVFFWRPSVMTRLCIKALEAGIEVDYVQNFIRTCNLFPDKSPLEIENWPWPLKVYTLGRFGLVRNGKPVQFSGKAQKKPLSILKALIALGGRDVREEHLTDLLWHEVEGDASHNIFATTLCRLRQLLGIEKAIKFHEGKTTLDHRYCWVDAWAFERICGQVDVSWKEGLKGSDIMQPIKLAEKAAKLYKGPFLAGDSEPWTISFRERLRNKFLRNIGRLGHYYEQTGQWEKAAEYYQKGLEVDELAEEFYQRLMVCYQRMGRRADAIAAYNRCRKILSSVLGIEPSPVIEALKAEVLKGNVLK